MARIGPDSSPTERMEWALFNAKEWLDAVSKRNDPGREQAIARWEREIKDIRTEALLLGITLKE